jgi:hypothetical protein
MSGSNLPLFAPSGFAHLIGNLARHEIQHVNRVLNFCSHESPESYYGARDGGFPCHEDAVVCDVESGLGFCLKHFHEQQ